MNEPLAWNGEVATDLTALARWIGRALPRVAPSQKFQQQLEAKLTGMAEGRQPPAPTSSPFSSRLAIGAILSLAGATLIWWRIRPGRRVGRGP